jgi:hypothetical protein
VTGATAIKTEAAPGLRRELDVLTPAERRDLANALLRAAWSAALGETRILLVDLLVEVDSAMVELRRDGGCG